MGHPRVLRDSIREETLQLTVAGFSVQFRRGVLVTTREADCGLVQGYLAHSKHPPPLEPPWDPR